MVISQGSLPTKDGHMSQKKPGSVMAGNWMCSVTTEKPIQASLYQVKKAEKERGGFKKKLSWPLRQLKLFDAKYINKVS